MIGATAAKRAEDSVAIETQAAGIRRISVAERVLGKVGRVSANMAASAALTDWAIVVFPRSGRYLSCCSGSVVREKCQNDRVVSPIWVVACRMLHRQPLVLTPALAAAWLTLAR